MTDKPRILIVEDDADVAEMLKTFFSTYNYEVLHAAWGEEGLRIAREELLSVIMLDIRLPDISGYEVCRQLRQQRRTQDVPILFLTEKRDRVDKLQGLELGVVDYITKPFDIQELQLRVRNAIQRSSQQNLINPITELPDIHLLDEKLLALLTTDKPWAILILALHGLQQLREAYGFVAADDLLRAVTMIARSSLREHGKETDFIGHLAPEMLAIITTPEKLPAIRQRSELRIRYSLENFYRPKGTDDVNPADFLRLQTGAIETTPFPTLDAIKERLFQLGE